MNIAELKQQLDRQTSFWGESHVADIGARKQSELLNLLPDLIEIVQRQQHDIDAIANLHVNVREAVKPKWLIWKTQEDRPIAATASEEHAALIVWALNARDMQVGGEFAAWFTPAMTTVTTLSNGVSLTNTP